MYTHIHAYFMISTVRENYVYNVLANLEITYLIAVVVKCILIQKPFGHRK